MLVLFVGVVALNFVFVRSDDPEVPWALAATDRRASAMHNQIARPNNPRPRPHQVQQLAATVKPALGAVCASLFLAAISLAATAGDTASESTRREEKDN